MQMNTKSTITQPGQPTDLGNIRSRLSSLSQELLEDGERIYHLTNRVAGSVPEQGGSPVGPAAVPNGAVAEINEAIDGLFHRVAANRDTLRRLENLA